MDLDVRQNEFGSFGFARPKRAGGGQPTFSVFGSSLCAENARHGVFETPLHKTVVISDLKVEIDDCSGRQGILGSQGWNAGDSGLPNSGSPSCTAKWDPDDSLLSSRCPEGKPSAMCSAPFQFIDHVQQELQNALGDTGLKISIPLDVSNTTCVVIKDLYYSYSRYGQLELSVKCKRATLRESISKATLRGCVTVTAEGGRILMSDQATWDLQNNMFSIPGSYVLSRDGVQVNGRDALWDCRLNVLSGDSRIEKQGPLVPQFSAAVENGFIPRVGRRQTRMARGRFANVGHRIGLTKQIYREDRGTSVSEHEATAHDGNIDP